MNNGINGPTLQYQACLAPLYTVSAAWSILRWNQAASQLAGNSPSCHRPVSCCQPGVTLPPCALQSTDDLSINFHTVKLNPNLGRALELEINQIFIGISRALRKACAPANVLQRLTVTATSPNQGAVSTRPVAASFAHRRGRV